MAVKKSPNKQKVRTYPPPSKEFDPFTASKKDMLRHGLPLRPDPFTQPGLTALWDRLATRYRSFEHLTPTFDTTTATLNAIPLPVFGPAPIESCGFHLSSTTGPFSALFITWTVPDLHYAPGPFDPINNFHTFVGLGFLDVHVEMTVDPQQNVTSHIWAEGVGNVNLPVRPGDVISGALCLNNGRANYVLANDTTGQRMNFTAETGFPPAVTINAGVTRTGHPSQPPFLHPLARFGTVYFDEISAYATDGSRKLTSGEAITMVNEKGDALAKPYVLNDYAFKVVFEKSL